MNTQHTFNLRADPVLSEAKLPSLPEFGEWRDAFTQRVERLSPSTKPNTSATAYRTLELDHTRAQAKSRTIEATLSAGSPVRRRGYIEELVMDESAVDLSRAQDMQGLPLLWSHDPASHLGFAENVRIFDGKLRANLRFTDSEDAIEKWRSIVDGTLRGVSIGYTVDQDQWVEANGQTPRMIVERWTPHEASIVTIPADTKAVLGRSLDMGLIREHPKELYVLERQRELLKRFDIGCWVLGDEPEESYARAEKEIHEFQKAIMAIRSIDDIEAAEAAEEVLGSRIDEIQAETSICSIIPDQNPRSTMLGKSSFTKSNAPMNKQYSLCRAIAAQFDPQTAAIAGYEREVTEALQQRGGRPSSEGIIVPESALFSRALDKATEGGDLVSLDHMGTLFIDRLRPRLVVGKLGATLLPGLQGDVRIPRQSGDSTAAWIVGDGADSVAQSTPTFDNITMAPRTVGVQCTISRKMLLQGDPASEQLVRDELARAIAQAIDVAALVGTGTGNQPTGIVNTTGIGSLTYTNGGTPDFEAIVNMEGELAIDNADLGNLGYVAHSAIAMTLKRTQVVSGQDRMIWTHKENGRGSLNGYQALVSNNLTAGHVLFGNWTDLLIGFWSGVDITVDPYTRAAYGDVIITTMQDMDIAVRHAESFCELKEA